MIARKFWEVLIIDDEPDIHELTDLLLKKEQFYGLKLKLHHANSAQQAMELIKANPAFDITLGVALVDVVMETDHAGLDFCKFVREERRRETMSLILRTGQPGMAPPRAIVDKYDITSYLTKMEATADRLYMLMKLGLHRYYEISLVQNRNYVMDYLRAAATSKADMLAKLQGLLSSGPASQDYALHAAHDFFGEYYAGCGAFTNKADYLAIKNDLMAKAAPQLTPHGNRIAVVDNYHVIQAKVLGTEKVATMVLRDSVIPGSATGYYAAIIRQGLGYMAEVLART
jgi:CheY-like chemotaxis protein